jgi:phosphatidylethanolamine-binding protein (PEBP) family uncharacterized protein
MLLAACDTGDGTTLRPPDTIQPSRCNVDATLFEDAEDIFALRSPAFPIDGPIPLRYGEVAGVDSIWPELLWQQAPEETVELALLLIDNATGDVLWAVGGLDPANPCIPEGELPAGAVQYNNQFGEADYRPPDLSDDGETRYYVFRLHALDQPLTDVAVDADVEVVTDAIEERTIDTTLLVGSSATPATSAPPTTATPTSG